MLRQLFEIILLNIRKLIIIPKIHKNSLDTCYGIIYLTTY